MKNIWRRCGVARSKRSSDSKCTTHCVAYNLHGLSFGILIKLGTKIFVCTECHFLVHRSSSIPMSIYCWVAKIAAHIRVRQCARMKYAKRKTWTINDCVENPSVYSSMFISIRMSNGKKGENEKSNIVPSKWICYHWTRTFIHSFICLSLKVGHSFGRRFFHKFTFFFSTKFLLHNSFFWCAFSSAFVQLHDSFPKSKFLCKNKSEYTKWKKVRSSIFACFKMKYSICKRR